MLENTVLNNRYQLEEHLGAGGMAMVYRAHDLTLERTVAIKLLRKDFSDDPDFRRRFHQEAKAAARLSHPNIVTVHDFGLYADQIFIVMEYVPGTDLKSLLKSRGKFSLEDALDLAAQACAGIGYAHRSGLVHCDIKPQNMLVTPDNTLKVVDFGIARALTSISPDERSDVVWGSPQYFSPEQASGGAPSPASDVYSLGVVLFEMLTGRLPFNGTTAEELARLHREALAPSPRRYNPAIPPALEQIVLKVLAKEPSSRYRTADQLGRVLVQYRQQQPAANGSAETFPAAPALSDSARRAALPPTPANSIRRPATRPNGVRPGSTVLAGGNYPADSYGNAASEEIYMEVEPAPEVVVITPNSRYSGFDLLTWMLGLLATIAVVGLIIFWAWVLYRLNLPV